MNRSGEKRGKQGTWWQAFRGFGLAALVYLLLRWLLIEPFVIPSGSMLPTLLIHDYILVNKLAYGLRVPFTKRWLVHFSHPKRGEIVVFRSIEDDEHYLVKRVVAEPGDEIEYTPDGRLLINQQEVPAQTIEPNLVYGWPEGEETRGENLEFYHLKEERLGENTHLSWLRKVERHHGQAPVKVPAGHYFMMGDNRDNSQDSRFWGFLPEENVLGRASLVWLSCGETVDGSRSICDPAQIRWPRIFHWVR